MSEEEPPIRSVDQLPNDPLKMPPPYWRSCGAIIHLTDALSEVIVLLQKLVPVHEKTAANLAKYYAQGERTDDEFWDIYEEQWSIEIDIRLKCELACLMAAIEAEDSLNAFCVYNLHKDVAEPIEKLAPPDKLLVASASVGAEGTKGTKVYEGVRKLVSWRNAFAHGHCVDRPTKSLRHNHLISPDEYPGVPSSVTNTTELIDAFLLLNDYLCSISINPYTANVSENVEDIREHCGHLRRFQLAGNQHAYSIDYAGDTK